VKIQHGERLRVLHIVSSTRRRGAEVFAVDLARSLSLEFESAVFALDGGGDLPVDVHGGGRFAPGTLRSLRAHARQADVVVAHGSSALLGAYIATRWTRVPYVYRSIGDPLRWTTTRTRRLRVGIMLRRAARIVALWPEAREGLIGLHRLAPENVCVVPNGVDTRRFALVSEEARQEARRSFSLHEEDVVLSIVGALSAEKDPETAVRAAARVARSKLLMVGDGPLLEDLRAVADRVMPHRAVFLPALDDIRPVLAASDVLLLTSRTEGLPAVLIEAGLSGVPVVATRVGGVPTIVSKDVGRLVQPGDVCGTTRAIEAILEQARRDKTAGRAHCEQRFALDLVAAPWARLLRAVARESGRG
jgi:glycosyltransferase involved in cell wall biosynthesis